MRMSGGQTLAEKWKARQAWRKSHILLPRKIHRVFEQEELGKRLEPFRNLHAGQRCFIIGNGPSLRPEDLDRLQGEICFGSNYIGKIYDRTAWRVTYFSCMDPMLVTEQMDSLVQQGQKATFLPVYAENWEAARAWLHTPGVYPVEMTHGFPANIYPPFSDNAAEILYGGYSVTYCLMQLAAFMGFADILLLGMDHTYAYNMNFGQVMDSNADRDSHFYKDVHPTGTNLTGVTNAYASAKAWADAHGIRIRNATRGGYLEVFDRVNFDALFPGKAKEEEAGC